MAADRMFYANYGRYSVMIRHEKKEKECMFTRDIGSKESISYYEPLKANHPDNLLGIDEYSLLTARPQFNVEFFLKQGWIDFQKQNMDKATAKIVDQQAEEIEFLKARLAIAEETSGVLSDDQSIPIIPKKKTVIESPEPVKKRGRPPKGK